MSNELQHDIPAEAKLAQTEVGFQTNSLDSYRLLALSTLPQERPQESKANTVLDLSVNDPLQKAELVALKPDDRARVAELAQMADAAYPSGSEAFKAAVQINNMCKNSSDRYDAANIFNNNSSHFLATVVNRGTSQESVNIKKRK